MGSTVVGFAIDPWRLKATMGSKLVGDDGEGLESDEEKASYLAACNFKWAEEALLGGEVGELGTGARMF